jgi:PTS system mannitol-specific IIC component
MSDYTPKVTGTGVKASVQRFGGYLAGMVMPNIGAFIASPTCCRC